MAGAGVFPTSTIGPRFPSRHTGRMKPRRRPTREHSYPIVKQNLATGAISFIDSPDFDTDPEPIVGDSWLVRADGTTRFRKQAADPYLYHHKWLMVGDEYTGFDVRESQRRSLAWSALPNIDRARIGRKSYWSSVVLPRLFETARQSPVEHARTFRLAIDLHNSATALRTNRGISSLSG
ncbi:MAG TPA: hypothetical protein VFJ58_26415 [Armatimonadota bacterium]|nr:hypothetical protein [Armatimonadota bacterium]